VSGCFRIKFTLRGGIGLFTSPPSDNLELALRLAADLERRHGGTIERIVGSDGYFFLDRDGCARLLRTRSGRPWLSPGQPGIIEVPKRRDRS